MKKVDSCYDMHIDVAYVNYEHVHFSSDNSIPIPSDVSVYKSHKSVGQGLMEA